MSWLLNQNQFELSKSCPYICTNPEYLMIDESYHVRVASPFERSGKCCGMKVLDKCQSSAGEPGRCLRDEHSLV